MVFPPCAMVGTAILTKDSAMDLSGKTVLITGASRGIGEASVAEFAAAGAKVVLTARSKPEIDRIAALYGDQVLAIAGDIADPAFVTALIDQTVAHFGAIDVVINNAAALPHMMKSGEGIILTVSSGAAHNPLEGWSAYCASKAAAAMMTRSLHLEYGWHGISSMGLSPGTVATQMQRDIKASGMNPVSELDWSDHVPPSWPAKAMVYMCENAKKFAGQELALRDPDLRKAIGVA
ncbi:MAG: SDR family NAD(P)-dependent oxidoreductase [Rhodobacteraceae bacterium]|nr:SDR family NAD(P)-dependent oxidoreductase [Paracoccaceae bacterium]